MYKVIFSSIPSLSLSHRKSFRRWGCFKRSSAGILNIYCSSGAEELPSRSA